MKKNNKNGISDLFCRGFEPKNNVKVRIKMQVQQKVMIHKLYFKVALVLGSILLLVGVNICTRDAKVQYLGPNAGSSALSYNDLLGQNFGESGPRGLEVNYNYIHFQ